MRVCAFIFKRFHMVSFNGTHLALINNRKNIHIEYLKNSTKTLIDIQSIVYYLICLNIFKIPIAL